jgi:hypothetical protein
LIARDWLIDHRDFVSMNLLRSEQWPFRHSNVSTHFAMNGIEALQCLGFVM